MAFSAVRQLLESWAERDSRYMRSPHRLTDREIEAALMWRRSEAEALQIPSERLRALNTLSSWSPVTVVRR